MKARTRPYGRWPASSVVALVAWAPPSQAFRMLSEPGRRSSQRPGALVTCNDPGGFHAWTQANVN